ncbi:VRR-NUC domain-containing protein [uncultured Psychrobacter sp.]|uniref:VRR-NUC domain-containing protein n=1 Tax=uncultured Psychrobacter sp. TaxID=259303 RepID=UPI00261EB789|nr:VRR-NUC domain-containing protein [uncultured Psychrobacter sp.]
MILEDILKMRLEQQCSTMALEFKTIDIAYENSPENAALEYFKGQGYIGTSNEGSMFQNVLKALMLDELARLNTFGSREDACSRYLEAQLTIHQANLEQVIKSISKTTRERFIANLDEIINEVRGTRQDNGLSLETGIAIVDALPRETLTKLTAKFSENPYGYRKGWPDLTLIKGNEIRLVEIKTKDKLHRSQLTTIPMLNEILPSKAEVLKLRRII